MTDLKVSVTASIGTKKPRRRGVTGQLIIRNTTV
jgi:hypothetical protein